MRRTPTPLSEVAEHLPSTDFWQWLEGFCSDVSYKTVDDKIHIRGRPNGYPIADWAAKTVGPLLNQGLLGKISVIPDGSLQYSGCSLRVQDGGHQIVAASRTNYRGRLAYNEGVPFNVWVFLGEEKIAAQNGLLPQYDRLEAEYQRQPESVQNQVDEADLAALLRAMPESEKTFCYISTEPDRDVIFALYGALYSESLARGTVQDAEKQQHEAFVGHNYSSVAQVGEKYEISHHLPLLVEKYAPSPYSSIDTFALDVALLTGNMEAQAFVNEYVDVYIRSWNENNYHQKKKSRHTLTEGEYDKLKTDALNSLDNTRRSIERKVAVLDSQQMSKDITDAFATVKTPAMLSMILKKKDARHPIEALLLQIYSGVRNNTTQVGIGQGLLLTENGIVLTSRQALTNLQPDQIYARDASGNIFSATGLVAGPTNKHDIALVKFTRDGPAKSTGFVIGEQPLKLGDKVTHLARQEDGLIKQIGLVTGSDETIVRASVYSQKGFSGSPLLDDKGWVTGIVTGHTLDPFLAGSQKHGIGPAVGIHAHVLEDLIREAMSADNPNLVALLE